MTSKARGLAALLLALSCLSVGTPVLAAEPDPLTCEGYPEPRQRLGTQDWWEPIPELGTLGHVHLEMCFPVGQTVSGIVRFDIDVVRHENKGTLTRVKGQDDKSKNFLLLKPNIASTGDRADRFTVFVNTANMPDGLRLFRWYADILHTNGNKQTARAGWPLDVENGKTDTNGAKPGQFKFQNWYREASPAKDWGYTGPTITPKGNGVFAIKCSTNGGPAIDRTIIHVDPDFHAGNDGTVIKDVAGAFNGTITITQGTKLVVRCQQLDGGDRHEGVGVIGVNP